MLARVLSEARTAGRLALVGAPAGTGKSALLGMIALGFLGLGFYLLPAVTNR